MAVYSYLHWKEKKAKDEWEDFLTIIPPFVETSAFKWEVRYDEIQIVCEKANGRYLISHPRLYAVPENSFLANVKNFNTTQYVSIVDTSTNEEREKWGIDRTQAYSLFLTNRDREVEIHTLYRGKKTVAPKGYYLAYNRSPRIYSVEEWVVKALEKKVEDLRDKDFLRVEPEEIVELQIGDQLRVRKGKAGWNVNGQSPDRVNTDRVDTLVQMVGFMRAQKVLSSSRSLFSNPTRIEVLYRRRRVFQKKVFFMEEIKGSWHACLRKNAETSYLLDDACRAVVENPAAYYWKADL